MTITEAREGVDLLVVQPALEPWPSGIRKIGRMALFFYVRWSTWGIGVEVLSAGAAVYLGPLMIGACHIRRQQATFDEMRTEA